MPEPEPNLQEIHDVLFDIALEAGDMITSANPSTVDTKKNCPSSFQAPSSPCYTQASEKIAQH